MPWKSEKINIKNTQYDRRVKLTDEQREPEHTSKTLYNKGKIKPI